jgi:putative ABC transport system ATP-binding protein
MSVLLVSELTKTYPMGDKTVVALNRVSFSVEKGEFVCLIGKSGSGKSTLLHLLAGLDAPDFGKAVINGTDILKLKGDETAVFRRREIGLIYQFYNLLPILTVEENITLPARLDKRKIDTARLNSLLELLSLTERRRHLPNQLSGGQQQRAAIGRALFCEPSIILADEPTGNLDAQSGSEIIEHLIELNKKFRQTVIIVTHDPQIAESAGRVITLADGKIIKDTGVI